MKNLAETAEKNCREAFRRIEETLMDYGVEYAQVDLSSDGTPKYDEITEAVKGAKVAYIQRSRGYSLRSAFTVSDIAEIVKAVRKGNPDAIVMVDNCYGEFVEDREPSAGWC